MFQLRPHAVPRILGGILLLHAVTGCGARGSAPPSTRDTGHPVLLVVAQGESDTARLWEAILQERFGACDLVEAEDFGRLVASGLPQRQLVVLTHAFLSSTDSSEAQLLRPILEQGTIAILDRPVQGWDSAAGLRTIGRAALPHRWPVRRWALPDAKDAALPFSGARAGVSSSEPERELFPAGRDAQGELEYLVQRPQVHGVRNVGAPLDLPTAWWSPAGRGGWLSLSLPLAEFIAELRASPRLDAREQTLWASAMVESTLDPDVFALPLPRVWPRATPSAPRNGAEGDRLRARRGVHWELGREGEGSYRLTLHGPGTAEPLEIALPLEWRGQVLADWDSDWEGANSRKVLGPRREWRLIRAPQGEGILRYRYTPAQDSVPWR